MTGERERQAVDRLKTSLLQALEEFLDAHGIQRGRSTEPQAAREGQLATAALLLQMTRAADFRTSHQEGVAVRKALESVLALSSEDAMLLVRLASQGDRLFTPLMELTSLLNAAYGPQEKAQLLERLWQVAFADAEILAHEEYFIRKVAELLRLSTADLIEAKVRAFESFR